MISFSFHISTICMSFANSDPRGPGGGCRLVEIPIDLGRVFIHVLFKIKPFHQETMKELSIMNILQVVGSKSDHF